MPSPLSPFVFYSFNTRDQEESIKEQACVHWQIVAQPGHAVCSRTMLDGIYPCETLSVWPASFSEGASGAFVPSWPLSFGASEENGEPVSARLCTTAVAMR